MPLSKKANRKRMRDNRKVHAAYVHTLETEVLGLEAENALLRGILAKQEETGYSWERENEQDRKIAGLQAVLAVERSRTTQLEAENVLIQTDLARIEMMVESMMHESPCAAGEGAK